MARPSKRRNPLVLARELLEEGRFDYTPHAIDRQLQREINDFDVEYAIKNGWHEKKKDEYKEEYKSWNYAIRGENVDGKRLRIAIAFEPDEQGELLVIITVIDLDSEA